MNPHLQDIKAVRHLLTIIDLVEPGSTTLALYLRSVRQALQSQEQFARQALVLERGQQLIELEAEEAALGAAFDDLAQFHAD